MFLGEFKHSIDQKGRVAIPAKFRAKLSRGAVVTRGLDNCLFLYPKEEWEELAHKLAQLPISQKDARAFARLMLSGAMEVEIDKQGRVTLPQYLREYAKIKDEAILAGLYSRIEIWDKEEWEKYKKESESQNVDIAERLGELGI
jgi:MraZ protein